jgi:hypothetical protein
VFPVRIGEGNVITIPAGLLCAVFVALAAVHAARPAMATPE